MNDADMPMPPPAASTSATASLTSTTMAASGVNSRVRLPTLNVQRSVCPDVW